jgi:integrase/recombinase XerD
MSTLRQRMTQDLKIRNYSPRTIEVYIDRVAKFAHYFGKSPDRLGPAEIREFQRYLVEEKTCSWSLLNQTVCALRFFYGVCLDKSWMIDYIPHAKQPKKLPVVLSRQEVSRLFEAADNLTHRTLLMTLYSTGLRLSEALALQVSDIDSQRMLLRIRQGKGAKDRYVPLTPTLLEQLRQYWSRYRPAEWLFPGKAPPPASCDRFGTEDLQKSGPPGRPVQKRLPPYAAPQLRHASSGSGHRFEDHSGVAGP